MSSTGDDFHVVVRPEPPQLRDFGNDYESYASAYRVYLELMAEHSRVASVESRPVAQTVVRFAPQVQRYNSPPPNYAQSFQDGSSSDDARRQSFARLGVSNRGRRAVSPSVSVANSNLSANSDRVRRLAVGARTSHQVPDSRQVQQGLSDVLDQDLILWLETNNRVPKTFRSLNNLRELALRRNAETGHRLMRKNSWAIVTRGSV